METTDRFQEFRNYIENHIAEKKDSIEAKDREKAEFLSEYPLMRIKGLSVDEY